MRAIRAEVGPDFHLQFKISAEEHHDEVLPWLRKGNTLEESLQVCRWLEEAGVDAFHVSTGGIFPHPRNPAGSFPIEDVVETYDTMLSSGKYTFRNYVLFRIVAVNRFFKWRWERPSRSGVEGINLAAARAVKEAVSVPVICAGGFQTASVIARAIAGGDCDAVSMARPLLANPDLPPVRPGARPGAEALHLLQQVPRQLRREPARLLRGAPLLLPRGDDPRTVTSAYEPAAAAPWGASPRTEPYSSRWHSATSPVKNRVLRSNIAGRFDNYDGRGRRRGSTGR